MNRGPVLSKTDWYRRSRLGEFGNVNPEWFTIREWEQREILRDCTHWGVRHTRLAGFKGTALNVETEDVVDWIVRNGFGSDYQISPMIWVFGQPRFEGNVCRQDGEPGLLVEGNIDPAPGTWRLHMQKPRVWARTAGVLLLRHLLNGNSYDDLMELIDGYPDHVVELTALSSEFGTVPGRNGIIWEVRRY